MTVCKTPNTKPNIKPAMRWEDINWVEVEEYVFKLQTKIYKASKDNDVKQLRRLQDTLIQSWRARSLAVRRVTMDNTGKDTPGVDGIKSLKPKERVSLIQRLKRNLKGKNAKPLRRVHIPKPGRKEKRPLGIPTIEDRALQALYKIILEPEWEARFEENSYGFRPGRSCQDAIEAIFNQIRYKPKYVLDADISKCFDKINHEKLLDKLDTKPSYHRQIKSWLKSGIIDNRTLFPTIEGTPQGGVISPLLANIALHGLEQEVKEYVAKRKNWNPKVKGRRDKRKSVSLIRYADDFVIMHEDIEVLREVKELVENKLGEYGLTLNENKTRVVHTLEEFEGNKPGFDFLGFNIRQWEVGKHSSGKGTSKQLLGHKTVIQPSDKSINKHYESIKDTVNRLQAVTQEELIAILNPKIRGWSNYFMYSDRDKARQTLRFKVHRLLMSWAKKRHSNKTWGWIKRKYWRRIGKVKWNFATDDTKLTNHFDGMMDIPTSDFRKVKGEESPYNGNEDYWKYRSIAKRSITKSYLLRKQEGRCTICGANFKPEQIIEIDHIIPKKDGGEDNLGNLQLLHKHCHIKKTTAEAKARLRTKEAVARA